MLVTRINTEKKVCYCAKSKRSAYYNPTRENSDLKQLEPAFFCGFFRTMDEIIYKKAQEFLDPIYQNVSLLDKRPFITLTFAQSLDGKIAKRNQQILISGKESMAMTHRLRTLHDGILVGIGTALVDDPQLNGRQVFILQ